MLPGHQIAALCLLVITRGGTRIVRLGVSVATSGDVRDQPKVADAAFSTLAENS